MEGVQDDVKVCHVMSAGPSDIVSGSCDAVLRLSDLVSGSRDGDITFCDPMR